MSLYIEACEKAFKKLSLGKLKYGRGASPLRSDSDSDSFKIVLEPPYLWYDFVLGKGGDAVDLYLLSSRSGLTKKEFIYGKNRPQDRGYELLSSAEKYLEKARSLIVLNTPHISDQEHRKISYAFQKYMGLANHFLSEFRKKRQAPHPFG